MIFEKIKKIICEQLDIDPEMVTLETSFTDDLEADSLDLVEVAMAIEDAFGIPEIDEEDVKNIHTVGDMVNYVASVID